LIGGLLLVSGFEKIWNPGSFVVSIENYHIIPNYIAPYLAIFVSGFELLAGLFLIVGLYTDVVSILVILQFAVYLFVLSDAILTGKTDHACGCFTVFQGQNAIENFLFGGNTITYSDLIRDSLLLLLTAIIPIFRVRKWSLDRLRHASSKRNQSTNPSLSKWLIPIGFVVVAIAALSMNAIAFVGIAKTSQPGLAIARDYKPLSKYLQVGQKEVNFILKTISGQMIQLSQERGKVILLEFFALWCPYCRDEAPVLNQLDQLYRHQPFKILSVIASPYGIHFEDSHFTNMSVYRKQDVQWYQNQFSVTHPMLLDPHFQVTNAYGVNGYPIFYLIGRQGTIRKLLIGPVPEVQIMQAIQQVIAQK
jgi:thiol-disulfide isomerase/thioredoxin/uncharacterized membrane protein YphA (DoxX/SURF4 family)